MTPQKKTAPLHTTLYWVAGFLFLGLATAQQTKASYAETILADQPIGYWQLNEAPGATTAADSSGNDFSGTYEGEVVMGEPGPLWDGSESRSVVFDGATTFVIIEDIFQDITFHHSFTLEAWVKNAGQPGNRRILSNRTPDGGFGWGLNGAQAFLFTTFGVLDYFNNENTLPADNEWRHYVVTLDENFDARFYVDGELAGMVEGPGEASAASENLTIGGSADHGTPEHWNGSISDVAIYDRILTEQEIRAHYEAAEIPQLELTNLQPANGSSYVDPEGGIRLDILSPDSGVAPEGIEFILNGRDRTDDLVLSGDEAQREIHFPELEADRFYSAEITVTDQVGFSNSISTTFNTFSEENFTWEANDWNFGGGQFFDNPGIDFSDPDNYFDRMGVDGVDEHTISEAGNDAYRLGSPVGTEPANDHPREPWASDDRQDAVQYNVGWVAIGEWLNYTRTFPAGEYHVYARLAFGGSGPFGARLDRVTSDRTQPDQTTETLGTFRRSTATGGWQNYVFVPLLDDDGNLTSINLSGVETLRVTAVEGGYNANFYMLVPADDRPPMITDLSPRTGEVIDSRDGLSFNIQSDAGVAREDIRLSLNGQDRTGEFTITGDENLWSVSFNNLQPSQNYTLSINVTDADGNNHFLFTGSPVQVAFETATVVPAAFATPLGSGRDPGFTVQVHNARDDAGLANSTARGEAQLAGELIDPDTGEPFENLAIGQPGDQVDGFFIETGTINYEQTDQAAGFFPDTRPYPGIVPEGDPNSFAIAAMGYLELEAGTYRFGVRSDDGFRLTVGPFFDQSTVELGVFDGGRGAGEGMNGGGTSEFDFLVEEDGVYAFRLLQYEGGGGASVEFYSRDIETGERTLINAPGGIQAFQNREGDPDIPEPVDGIPAPTIVWDGNNHVISWEGTGFTLESADEITGPWQALEATSPHTVTDDAEKRFFRLRTNAQ